MTTPIKTVRKPRPLQHICKQEEIINKINKILIGNGTPEDGLLYKVSNICKDIKDIKAKISIVVEINTELEIQNRVNIALRKQKDELITKTEEKEIKILLNKRGRIGLWIAGIAVFLSLVLWVIGLFANL